MYSWSDYYLPSALVLAFAVNSVRSAGPQVTLDNATFIGSNNGSTDRFFGIPFAKPPIDDLRLRLPVANDAYNGTYNTTSLGSPCIQQKLNLVIPDSLDPDAQAPLEAYLRSRDFDGTEDCLTINVWKPSNVSAGTKLPVLIYIYGGGFDVGEQMDGTNIVERSITIGEPIIYVNFNYRLSALGWLGGAEVKAAGTGSLGLHDQREALRWVQKYISSFDGDGEKVTIWGQSAGAISVALQMLVNDGNTEGLFHAALMESGAALPVGDLTNGQEVYDTFAKNTGCQNSTDTLQCLRQAPLASIKQAIDASNSFFSPSSLNLAWTPRADGVFLKDPPQKALLEGKIANIPFISGNCDDEGTIFSVSLANITTNEAFESYIHSNYFPHATSSELDKLFALYPNNVTSGSPFDTGTQNAWTPEAKRLAAIQGDFTFFAPRRLFVQKLAEKQNAWVYLWKKNKSFVDLGSAHGLDLDDIYGPGNLTDYVIRFVNYLDPNGRSTNDLDGLFWPRYTTSDGELLTLLDGPTPLAIDKDDFREEAIEAMVELSLKYPL